MGKIIKEKKKHSKVNLVVIKYFKLLFLGVLIFSIIVSYATIKSNRDIIRLEVAREITSLSAQVSAKQLQVIRLNRKVEDYDFIKDQSLEVVKKILPPLSRKSDLLLYIRDMLLEDDYIVKSINLGQERGLNKHFVGDEEVNVFLPIVVIPIQVHVEGSAFDYAKMKNFFRLLYNRYFIFSVEQVTIGQDSFSQRNTPTQEATSFALEINVFLLDDITEAANTAASQKAAEGDQFQL